MSETQPRFGSAEHYLARMEQLMAEARRQDGAGRVAALARVQRLSGWALRAAVTEYREQAPGPASTWRNLAPLEQMPFGTLYRQWKAGGRLVVSDGAPTEEIFEAPDDPMC